ncbi:hypothetical protein CVU37_11965 [candidate division BRC1 bacterium HGW-BRC1-1]|jgi:cephalosporin-C deacetylase-like acetyl esterase|nr:MAG: hypothetical protein CVU37_11965 [candidate division BRC1 bacterium HGW-BRC1-1]
MRREQSFLLDCPDSYRMAWEVAGRMPPVRCRLRELRAAHEMFIEAEGGNIMFKFKRFTGGVLAALWLVPAVAMGAPVKNDAGWKFSVEPAVHGDKKMSLTIDPMGSMETPIITLKDVGSSPSKYMAGHHGPGSGQEVLFTDFGVVTSDTFVDVTVTTMPDQVPPLFQWRTLLRPEGKTVADYKGIKDELTPPDDFEAYWKRARKELAAVPMKPVVTRVEEKDTSTGLLYRVELPTVEETTIVCWYYIPREAFDADGKVVKKHKAVQIAPGYGGEEPPLDRTKDGFITLSVNPRNHGPSREFWKSPVEHLAYNIEDPEHYYYKLAVLDVLRGAEFLFSREEVDTDRVGVEGGSQGGYFAVATAAFEPRIKCAASNVTAFSAYPEGMKLNLKGFATSFRSMIEEAETPAKAAAIRKSLAYTDGANLARLVKCPLQVNMGDTDPVCHYACGAVVVNRVPKGVATEYNVFPNCKHEVPPAMREANKRWYDKYL